MNEDREAWAVLNFYFERTGLVRQIEPLGSGGGWSGSRLWRIECHDDKKLCLRRWPPGHPTAERLRFIHGVLARVAAQSLTIVPVPLTSKSGETLVELQGSRWELTPWMPGQADFHSQPSVARLQAALENLARFHAYSALPHLRGDVAPSLIDRESQLTRLRAGELEAIASAVAKGLNPDLDSRARRILTAAHGRLADLETLVRVAVRQKLPLQPAIRDIHHDHVLFTGNEVTGILDFGALRIDTPLTDIARLIGSLVGDDSAAREKAFAAYAQVRPLSDNDRQLVDLLEYSGLVLGGLHWLQWLYVERRDMGEMAPIIRRLDEILARLER